jgi:hypothetical protein
MARRINTSSLDSVTRAKKRNHIRTGNMVEKIVATVKFNSELVNQINNDQKPRIEEQGLRLIAKYFEAYVDNLARINHSRFHHLYEPGKSGSKSARLFEASISSKTRPTLNYNFTPSVLPGESGYVFENRAFVMENGIPLNIKAKDSEYLRFEYEGEFYSKKQVYIANPGGTEVQDSFSETFNTFMTSMGDDALRELGFFQKIERGLANESRIALSRVSAGKIEGMAAEAAKSANRIVRGLK